jgi:hypothetical protein
MALFSRLAMCVIGDDDRGIASAATCAALGGGADEAGSDNDSNAFACEADLRQIYTEENSNRVRAGRA